ncbi:MAG TPA: isoaspartyl peptidase/L-asparaginase, partial [Candidatus Acidoferrales bacterium]|nr:isoaspartyl peptidase/L-asparaginase [Candidatus Acidoferrales bacterium]
MNDMTRRRFFQTAVASGLAGSARRLFGATRLSGNGAQAAKPVRPVIISSSNGLHALDRGMEILRKGGDTLDAVVAAVTVVEDDPNDTSVGYGGLPNEDGDVELDASVMHGPTRRAGAVASLRLIKNPARLAKVIMERTNHVMLSGPGALRYAEAQGF